MFITYLCDICHVCKNQSFGKTIYIISYLYNSKLMFDVSGAYVE